MFLTVVFNLTYDGNGNLVDDGTFEFEYDGFNRLRRIKEGGVLRAEYWYNPEGRRVKKTVYGVDGNNESTVYAGDFVRVTNSSGSFDTKIIT